MRWRPAATGLAAGLIVLPLLTFSPLAASETVLAQSAPSQLQAPRPPGKRKLGVSNQVQTYLHPVRKFTLAIPPGMEVFERGETVQVSIRSRQGYKINVQTGDARPKVSLVQMTAKLEAQYLGPGKPWSQKTNQRTLSVAGLAANETIYEGAGTRVRVVIARGEKSDFVFMFFAPRETYESLASKFDWILANFQPNPAEQLTAAGGGLSPGAGAKTGIAPKRFAEPGYGYSIQYPGDWVVTQSSANTAIFSGKKGTDAFHAIISIQNVKPPEAKTPAQASLRALADLKASLSREASSVVFVGEQPLTYKNENLSLEGRQIIVTYTFAGERYRKWALVVPRPSGTVAHIWSYTAPDSQFRTFRPFADAMLKSWTIRPGDG